MVTDARLQQLQRHVAAAERMLRELERRRDHERSASEQYYRLKAALTRRKRELKNAEKRVRRETKAAQEGGEVRNFLRALFGISHNLHLRLSSASPRRLEHAVEFATSVYALRLQSRWKP